METLNARKRTELGKNAVRQLRKVGDIPAILYGHKEEPMALTLSEHDVHLAIDHGERLITLDIDGEPTSALFKDIQWDTYGREILHADFTRIDINEIVEVTMPVDLVGTPMGCKEGGVLTQTTTEVTIKCPACYIPEQLKVIVNGLKLNGKLHLSDIKLPRATELVCDPETVLCTCAELAETPEPAEGEAPTEPEVIGKKSDEE